MTLWFWRLPVLRLLMPAIRSLMGNTNLKLRSYWHIDTYWKLYTNIVTLNFSLAVVTWRDKRHEIIIYGFLTPVSSALFLKHLSVTRTANATKQTQTRSFPIVVSVARLEAISGESKIFVKTQFAWLGWEENICFKNKNICKGATDTVATNRKICIIDYPSLYIKRRLFKLLFFMHPDRCENK